MLLLTFVQNKFVGAITWLQLVYLKDEKKMNDVSLQSSLGVIELCLTYGFHLHLGKFVVSLIFSNDMWVLIIT